MRMGDNKNEASCVRRSHSNRAMCSGFGPDVDESGDAKRFSPQVFAGGVRRRVDRDFSGAHLVDHQVDAEGEQLTGMLQRPHDVQFNDQGNVKSTGCWGGRPVLSRFYCRGLPLRNQLCDCIQELRRIHALREDQVGMFGS